MTNSSAQETTQHAKEVTINGSRPPPSKERTWREYMASVRERFEAARLEYEFACGPKAINLAGG